MISRALSISILIVALSQTTAAADNVPQLTRLSVSADSIVKKQDEQEWSSEKIKELLASETGEPEIEGTAWQKRKNPRTAMLCALAFPGLGQMYNEKPLKAVIAFGVETFYFLNIAHNYREAQKYLEERDKYDRYEPCGEFVCENPDWKFNNAWYEEHKERTIDWVWWSSAAILVVMLDAYVDAHLHDMRFRMEAARLGGTTGLSVVVDF